jgi:chromate transporter
MRIRTLAGQFLRIGATGFGGPMALIGLMHRNLVETREDVPEETFTEGLALGQMLPGPVAINCATYLGFRLRGLLGALVTAGGLILPAFLLMLVLSPLYLTYGQVPQVGGFFKGVAPAVVAVILAAGWRMGRKFVVDWRSGLVAGVVLVGSLVGLVPGWPKASPALLVLLGGILGLVIGPAPQPKEGTK